MGVLLLAVAAALPNVHFFDNDNRGDTPLYHQYGQNLLDGKVPYRDFFDEYPPGALPMFVVPAATPGAGFTFWSKSLQWLLAATCIAFAALAAGVARWRAALIGIAPALLGQITFTRFDFWPAGLAIGALATLAAGRHRLALALLAIAVAAKEYPVVLLPIFLLYVAARVGQYEAKIAAAVFGGVLAAIVLPFAALGPGGVAYSLDVQFRRPLQVESLGGSILLTLHRLGAYTPHVVTTYGSQNLSGSLASVLAILTTLLEVVALVAVWIVFARSRRDRDALLTASAAAVLAFVAFGKVLSPQYLIWVVPLVPLVAGRAWKWSIVVLAAVLIETQWWSQGRYHEVVHGGGIVWLVLLRDLLLVALFAVVYRGANQISKTPIRTSS